MNLQSKNKRKISLNNDDYEENSLSSKMELIDLQILKSKSERKNTKNHEKLQLSKEIKKKIMFDDGVEGINKIYKNKQKKLVLKNKNHELPKISNNKIGRNSVMINNNECSTLNLKNNRKYTHSILKSSKDKLEKVFNTNDLYFERKSIKRDDDNEYSILSKKINNEDKNSEKNKSVNILSRNNSLEINQKRKLKKIRIVYDSEEEEEIEEDEDDTKNQFSWVLNHEGYFLEIWENLILIIIFYTLIITPLTFSLHLFSESFNHTIDLIFDGIYISDIIIHCFTPFINWEEKLIKQNSLIIENYVTSWFLTDFISTLHILQYLSHDFIFQKIFKILSVYLRLLKTVKIIKKYQKIEVILINLDFSPEKITFFQYLLTFVFLVHNLSCTWIFMAEVQPDFNWIINSNLEQASSFDKYMAAVYFVWSSLFQTGYGDIVAINIYERICNIIILLIGVFFYSFIVSYLMSTFKSYDNAASKYAKNLSILDEVRESSPQLDSAIAKKKKILEKKKEVIIKEFESKTLYHQIKNHLDYINQIQRSEKFELLHDLPFNFRKYFSSKAHENYSKNFSFFKNIDDIGFRHQNEFINRFILKMKQLMLVRSDYILQEGEYLQEMIFIKAGIISFKLSEEFNNLPVFHLHKSDHYGMIDILREDKSDVNIRIKSKTAELFVIDKKDLIDLIINYGDIMKAIIKISTINYHKMKIYINEKKTKLTVVKLRKDLKDRIISERTKSNKTVSSNLKSKNDNPKKLLNSSPLNLHSLNKKLVLNQKNEECKKKIFFNLNSQKNLEIKPDINILINNETKNINMQNSFSSHKNLEVKRFSYINFLPDVISHSKILQENSKSFNKKIIKKLITKKSFPKSNDIKSITNNSKIDNLLNSEKILTKFIKKQPSIQLRKFSNKTIALKSFNFNKNLIEEFEDRKSNIFKSNGYIFIFNEINKTIDGNRILSKNPSSFIINYIDKYLENYYQNQSNLRILKKMDNLLKIFKNPG